MATPAPDLPVIDSVDVSVEGMTCAACVRRVEKKLDKIDGVSASVNLATESAHVDLHDDVTDEQIVAAVKSAGYTGKITSRASRGSVDESGDADTSTPDRAQDLRRRLIVSAILAVPVMVLSMVPAWQFDYWQWIVAALALPIATWCAWPFYTAAFRAARHGGSTMDTLVTLGVIASMAWSLWALLFGGAGAIGMQMDMSLWPFGASDHAHPHLYFETSAMIVTFLLTGRYIEARSRHRASDALRSLLDLGAKDAVRVTEVDGKRVEERIAISELREGDLFLTRPGEKIATDGVVVEGHSAVDESLLTGESVPVEVVTGNEVTGATISTSGALLVRATQVGDDTMLAHIGRLVTQAQTGKAPVQRLADRISSVFVPIVIGLAIATLVGWLLAGGGAEPAFTAAVAVLVIACPCALGLATPTALLVGTGRAASQGILIKGPEILESTRKVTAAIMDKTGTVTTGVMELIATVPTAGTPWHGQCGTNADPIGVEASDVLAAAASVESRSGHPVAAAITSGAEAAGLDTYPVTDFHDHAGLGVSATLTLPSGNTRVLVGRPSWLADQGIDVSSIAGPVAELQDQGATAMAVAWDGAVRGTLAVRDEIRPTSPDAIARLKDLGLTPYLLTGDNQVTAARVAHEVGIDHIHAEVLPADKVEVVAKLQRDGAAVAMVGDGVNDAAALAQADLGMSIGSGSDIAIEASDITLMRSDLAAVPRSIEISRRTLRLIKQNLGWAFSYNVAALPLAMAGLLNPGIAALAMACSSVIVVLNSLRLRSA